MESIAPPFYKQAPHFYNKILIPHFNDFSKISTLL